MIFNLAGTIKEWLDDNNVDLEELRKLNIFKQEEELMVT